MALAVCMKMEMQFISRTTEYKDKEMSLRKKNNLTF